MEERRVRGVGEGREVGQEGRQIVVSSVLHALLQLKPFPPSLLQ